MIRFAPGWRVVGLIGLLLLTGCTAPGSGSDDDRRGSFYGGLSGGLSRP